MSLDLSDTQVLYPKPVVAPQAGYQFMQPWYEDYQRRLGASVFGAPGQYSGLIDQPQPIPVEGTAGLSPMEIMARQGAMGAGPYQPGYDTATQLMGEATGGYRGSTGAFNPYTMISPYYNPYETDVVEDTLERMRRTSAQEDIAGRAQDISSGAFGGSRGRLLAGERQAESERGILGALAGIRGQGFQRAQEAAMGDYARRMAAFRDAASGLGGVAGQVLGMGGQRQGEMMNWLNMMNQYGGQGRDISQQRLSRLYQAALRKSQEPWERVMRAQALLQGMEPGKLIGGYETKVVSPETWQEPTGLGDVIETGGGIAAILKTLSEAFGWGQSEGGYIQKPKKYNEGGIVSGLVPIHMQEGGDPEMEEMDPETQNKIIKFVKENPWAAALDAAALALLVTPAPGARAAAGVSKLSAMALRSPRVLRGIQSLLSRSPKIAERLGGKSKFIKSLMEAGPKGKKLIPYNPKALVPYEAAGPSITKRALSAMKAHPFRTIGGATLLGSGLAALLGEDEKPDEVLDPEATEEWIKLKKEEIDKAKSKREKEKLWDDIITTTGRLSEMMHAPGRRQTTLADAARIFSEERMDLPNEEIKALEEMAEASGYSLKELLELTTLEKGLEGRIETQEQLAEKILQTGLEKYGPNLERHPDVLSGEKSPAQVRLEITNILYAMDYNELKARADQLATEEIELNVNE